MRKMALRWSCGVIKDRVKKVSLAQPQDAPPRGMEKFSTTEAEHLPSRQLTHYAPPQELESDAPPFLPAQV